LVLGEQLNVGHGLHQFGFHTNNLKLIRRDPGPSLEIHGVNHSSDFEIVNAIGTIVALPEVDQPRGLAMQLTHTFAK
jgi:hypothetical protein